MDGPITKAINSWRKAWERDRIKHGLGPVDDEAWSEHVNGLSISEVLFELSINDSEDE